MEDDLLISRWYDKDPKMIEVLKYVQKLTREEQDELAVTLIQLVNMLRQSRNEDEIPISIGKTRVLGLYKSSNKRRWYDKKSTLRSAMNIFSTLPQEDCSMILDGFAEIMSEQGYDLRLNIEDSTNSKEALC